MLVLAGRVDVRIGAELRTLGAGESLCLPRSSPRRAQVAADGPARLLCVVTPAGAERLCDLVGDPPLSADDVAAVLAGAGVSLLPLRWGL